MDLGNHVLSVLFAAPWFHLVRKLGGIQALLECGDEARSLRAVGVIGQRVCDWPDGAADYAFSFLERPEPWPKRAVNILSFCHKPASHRYVELVCRLLQEGHIEPGIDPNHGEMWAF